MEKCIDRNHLDIYEDGQYYSCLPDLSFVRGSLVRIIKVKCLEIPGTLISATVYSDN